jgi:hypothetical protein
MTQPDFGEALVRAATRIADEIRDTQEHPLGILSGGVTDGLKKAEAILADEYARAVKDRDAREKAVGK